LAAFQTVNNAGANHPKVNDSIFVYESASSYTGPVTLQNGQRLFGQDSNTNLQTLTGLTPQSYSDAFPSMNTGGNTATITSAGTAINLNGASGSNSLNGFRIGNSTTGITGTSFGTLNVGDVTINSNAQALNMTTGTIATPAN